MRPEIGEAGEDDGNEHQLQPDPGQRAPVDVGALHFLRGHAAQVEERESEWRRQERRLQVHGHHDAEPDRIHAHPEQHGGNDGDDDVDDLDEIDDESQQEHHEHHDRERAERVQIAVNRVQSEEETFNVIRDARANGFKSISVDLIYGLPHQTVMSFWLPSGRVQTACGNRP